MNVCQACGACCASFRVDFHPAELAGGTYAWGAGGPREMVLPVTPAIVRMAGTDAAAPRCVALAGTVGEFVACAIYAARPSPCREFDTSHEACARARQRHGLPPLADGLVPVQVG
jgi:Fe-S-cluster containining protein